MLNLFFSKIRPISTLFLTGLLLAISSILFSSCLKDDSNLDELNNEAQEAAIKQLAADTLVIKKYLADHNITNAKRTSAGIFYVEQTVGSGVQAQSGNVVKTDYKLVNLAGKVLDTSYGKTPYQFQLGSQAYGSPILGYQIGTSLLKVGGKSTFYLPSGLAYGVGGSPPDIVPNMVLIFEIELLEVR
jgi:FKBP-type peptidyl-prolyl cis-trans isomerase FkpA